MRWKENVMTYSYKATTLMTRSTWVHLRYFIGFVLSRSLVLCVCFVDRCLSFFPFFWQLYCLLFFDLRLLITLLLSSNCSCNTAITESSQRQKLITEITTEASEELVSLVESVFNANSEPNTRSRRGRDRMVVGFATACAISA
jgi:hypothetical protein